MRLDSWLTANNIVKSRNVAQTLIRENKIRVNGKICDKNSFAVGEHDIVELIGALPKYVGRGGIKLEYAIENFKIDLSGAVCIDVGASTGGFTDCMLQHGAAKVFAVDVGSNQLDEKLRNDNRVVSLENTDIRAVSEVITEKADFISIDVSFISLKIVLPDILPLLKQGSNCVALIKPQFEVGKKYIGKNGIVKDEKQRKKIVNEIIDFAKQLGFSVELFVQSPISGGDGNIEYLVHMRT